ncbi:hypothetical protein FFK22_016910 [Mycobacterium sp. KBS0706]|uniref:FIST N-terminal domain-containing protein n=1 Tax=Mycobacterium sp. KBS0706 TaxID=2578109 RepID=UPI00110F87E2|nr:FIST N-terminal domain-containing protein [Mycobacterium sp. KBS0706]TSD87524.1 hypothetical protein FFK22_016910 [Mycobacterium sp. KBS0706]
MLLQTAKSPVVTGYGRAASPELAALKCIEAIGNVSPKMLLVFCGGKLDGFRILSQFRDKYGDIPIVGGAAAGAIAGESFGYSGLEVTALALLSDSVTPHVLIADDLTDGEYEVSRRLGVEISERINYGDTITLFYDSVAANPPLKLHMATRIVAGLMDGCRHKRPTVLGGGLLTDLNLSEGWIFDGRDVRKHGLVALAWPSGVKADTFVMNGCVPASSFLEITRIDGAVVYELDGEPALSVLEQRLGRPMTTGPEGTISLLATLGQKQGDQFAPFDEHSYVNRLILTGDPAEGSVTLFEADFELGAKVQIMARDNALMLDSVRRGVRAANEIIGQGDTLFSLYIDCAGRASIRSGAAREEASLVVDGLDQSAPLIGLYSGVEIAPFDGEPRALDWTGLLAVMRYNP